MTFSAPFICRLRRVERSRNRVHRWCFFCFCFFYGSIQFREVCKGLIDHWYCFHPGNIALISVELNTSCDVPHLATRPVTKASRAVGRPIQVIGSGVFTGLVVEPGALSFQIVIENFRPPPINHWLFSTHKPTMLSLQYYWEERDDAAITVFCDKSLICTGSNHLSLHIRLKRIFPHLKKTFIRTPLLDP